jgi:hypothetical protein
MPRVEHWPGVAPEARWAVELMDELLDSAAQRPEELLARADELRVLAEASDIEGYREGRLRLAGRYEQAAAARRVSA